MSCSPYRIPISETFPGKLPGVVAITVSSFECKFSTQLGRPSVGIGRLPRDENRAFLAKERRRSLREKLRHSYEVGAALRTERRANCSLVRFTLFEVLARNDRCEETVGRGPWKPSSPYLLVQRNISVTQPSSIVFPAKLNFEHRVRVVSASRIAASVRADRNEYSASKRTAKRTYVGTRFRDTREGRANRPCSVAVNYISRRSLRPWHGLRGNRGSSTRQRVTLATERVPRSIELSSNARLTILPSTSTT